MTYPWTVSPSRACERERLHPGQLVARQLRTGGEQEGAGPAGPVVGEVLDRAHVVGEVDQPGRVGFVAADRLRVAGVKRPDRLEVGLHRRVEHVVLGAVLEHLDDLRLPGVRVQHGPRDVRLGVLEQHLASPEARSILISRPVSVPSELMASSENRPR